MADEVDEADEEYEEYEEDKEDEGDEGDEEDEEDEADEADEEKKTIEIIIYEEYQYPNNSLAMDDLVKAYNKQKQCWEEAKKTEAQVVEKVWGGEYPRFCVDMVVPAAREDGSTPLFFK